MSGYILCQTKKAQRPYFIENISMNIYSIEELCYYLYHNLYLADHTVFNEELCNWLRDELELVHLAAKLKQNLERNVSVEEMIYPVFKEINYLTYEEMKGFNSRIVTYGKEKAAVRQKRKGDALTENGMPISASLPGCASRSATVPTSFSPVRSFSSMTTAAPAFCSSIALKY